MQAVLLAAALALGSGDGRDGAADGRMVDETPPYALLRIGMKFADAKRLMHDGGSTERDDLLMSGPDGLVYRCGLDCFDRYRLVVIQAEGDRVTRISITPTDRVANPFARR
jgi:hypothetical protein